MSYKSAIIIAVVIVLALGASLFFFTVDEKELVVITELGKPKRVIKDAGLNIKIPFIEKVNRFEKRILEYDAEPKDIITKDKKTLLIDNYARWRITDPLKFMQTVFSVSTAQTRLDDIVYSELRNELGSSELIEILRTHVSADMKHNRNEIMRKVTEKSNIKTQEYGIEIVDVRIKRADLPEENARHIYGRMRAERERIAKKYRAEGEEEATKIRATTNKEREILLAEAYKTAQILHGEGEAEATRISADAYKKNPELYAFLRSLEVYENILTQNSRLVLTTNMELFRYLNNSKPSNPQETRSE